MKISQILVLFFILNGFTISACARPYEGYKPTTAKETAKAQETTMVGSMEELVENPEQVSKNDKPASRRDQTNHSGDANSKDVTGTMSRGGAREKAPSSNTDRAPGMITPPSSNTSSLPVPPSGSAGGIPVGP